MLLCAQLACELRGRVVCRRVCQAYTSLTTAVHTRATRATSPDRTDALKSGLQGGPGGCPEQIARDIPKNACRPWVAIHGPPQKNCQNDRNLSQIASE